MFLKASSQPAIGTPVHIDLELPSATVIELAGAIAQHVVDDQRGKGVELALEPLPTKTVWLIESALAAETKVRAQTNSGVPQEVSGASDISAGVSSGGSVATAEAELVRALEAEAESLKKLNPFLVLGIGYDTTDADVRAAFGELTKRYHPDRFARYQSSQLRTIAAEIFILIRDAYRKLADEASRAQVRQQLGVRPAPPRPKPPPPRAVSVPVAQPADRHSQPILLDRPIVRQPSQAVPIVAEPHAAQAQAVPAPIADADSRPVQRPVTGGIPAIVLDAAALEALLDQSRLDEALAGYRNAAKKSPQDRAARAGVELVEGMKALQQRDRMEAAQRFEAALEIDPSNERAARELAEMRRQATNERKGLLSRLMGKKEGPG